MQVRELLVPVPIVVVGEVTVKSLEEAVERGWKAFPSLAWQAAVGAVECAIEKDSDDALRRRGREERQLWTVSGPVEFSRQRYEYVDGREEKSLLAFDSRIGLAPYRRITDEASKRLSRLAALGPSFAKTQKTLEIVLGDSPSSWSVWQETQRQGEVLLQEDSRRRDSLFKQGEDPGADVPPKDFVGIQADSTFVHAWRSRGKNHEVFMGIAFDGKEKAGRRRWKLRNKVAAAGVGDVKRFGQDLLVVAERVHNVMEARSALFSSDGAPSLESLRDEHFPQALHQLDLYHAVDRLEEAYGFDRLEDVNRLKRSIIEDDRRKFERQSSSDRRHLWGRRSKLDEACKFISSHWEWLVAWRRLRREHPQLKLPPRLMGTGAQERTIGTVVGHRMKWRGMGWSKHGAAHMVRLRLEIMDLQN